MPYGTTHLGLWVRPTVRCASLLCCAVSDAERRKRPRLYYYITMFPLPIGILLPPFPRDNEDDEPSQHGDVSARAGGAAAASAAAGGSMAPGHRRPTAAATAFAPAAARPTVAHDDDAANRADLFGKHCLRHISCLNTASSLPHLTRLAFYTLHHVAACQKPLPCCHICACVQAALRLPAPPPGCSPTPPAAEAAPPPRAPAALLSPARAPRTRLSGRTAGSHAPPMHGERTATHGQRFAVWGITCTCIGICRCLNHLQAGPGRPLLSTSMTLRVELRCTRVRVHISCPFARPAREPCPHFACSADRVTNVV